MKIVAISDLHGNLPKLPACDLVLIAGDICPAFNHTLDFQRLWLETNFTTWLLGLETDAIIGTVGNHDLIYEHPELVPDLPCSILIDETEEYKGIKIFGQPWQVEFNDWAFNLSEEELAAKYELIPADTNILISHGPPFGYGDFLPGTGHLGSPSLTAAIKKHKIPLTLTAHIHAGFGRYEIDQNSTVYNVSLLDEQYKMVNPPTVIEL